MCEKWHKIFTVPGPSAISAAVSLSGFKINFYFMVFYQKKEIELNKVLKSLNLFVYSIVFLSLQ